MTSDDFEARQTAVARLFYRVIGDFTPHAVDPGDYVHWWVSQLVDPSTIAFFDWSPDLNAGREACAGIVVIVVGASLLTVEYRDVNPRYSAGSSLNPGIIAVTVRPMAEVRRLDWSINQIDPMIPNLQGSRLVVHGQDWELPIFAVEARQTADRLARFAQLQIALGLIHTSAGR